MKEKKTIYIELILIFVIILVLLPYIILPLGYKMRVVLSHSMKHPERRLEDFYVAWEKAGYGKDEVNKFPIPEGFERSDVLIEKVTKEYETKIGDVVVYKDSFGTTFMHRLVDHNATHFLAVGDWGLVDEKEINYNYPWEPLSAVEGKIIGKIPKIGFFWIILRCWQERNCNVEDCFHFDICEGLT